MSDETIQTYKGSDASVSCCLVTLEGFIGDMDGAELADDSTVDASDAVTAINGLIWSMERREQLMADMLAALRSAQEFIAADLECCDPAGTAAAATRVFLDRVETAIAKAEGKDTTQKSRMGNER